MRRPGPLRLALVHERFTELGGSEKVVEELYRAWPGSTVHAAIVDRDTLPPDLIDADVRASPVGRLHRPGSSYAPLLALLPLAFRQLDVGDVDAVVVSHHAFANRVRTGPDVARIGYVHTPARWMWEPHLRAAEVGGTLGRAVLRAFAATQRRADRAAGRRFDAIVVNSHHVAERVARYWGRRCEVVHPPVDTRFYTPDPSIEREDFYLVAGRLVPYKQAEVAAAAARTTGARLVVAGDGRSRGAVEAAGGRSVEMLGAVDDATLRDLYRRCRALVFPGEEDFGIVPVEAMACGAPVIARGIGGVCDTVEHGATGVLYPGDGVEALAAAMRTFDPSGFESPRIAAHARRFAPERFRDEMSAVVERAVAALPHPRSIP